MPIDWQLAFALSFWYSLTFLLPQAAASRGLFLFYNDQERLAA
jgi:hypothetical protein